VDKSKKSPDKIEKDVEERFSKLEGSISGKVERLTTKGLRGAFKDETCYAACPICITRLCAELQSHWGQHRCKEGHTWS